MTELTPRQIVAELDKHIIGQDDAKRSVAIALRNRWRWKQLPDEIRKEITPKNIIMIGPTGVGKTEITRRLANLTGAPFIKVEATKYTEVGYYGRDVESMVRDLVEKAINLVRNKKRVEVEEEAKKRVEERLLDLLLPTPPEAESPQDWPFAKFDENDELVLDEQQLELINQTPEAEEANNQKAEAERKEAQKRHERTREKFRDMLRSGALEDRTVELSIEARNAPVQVFSNMGMDQMDVDFQSMFERIVPREQKNREVKVSEARQILLEQEAENLMDKDAINEEAIDLSENTGIIFVDEIDKIAGGGDDSGKDVSRQGVQRDLLPIVEGTTISTRYGQVRTEHMLFIAAGAFHRSRPSDLMPELQGRFPIRVELQDLTRDDFLRILTEPASSMTQQYQELLSTEGVRLDFTSDGIEALADIAYQVNQSTQNIGARRLHTILERLLEDVSFEAPDLKDKKIKIDAEYVRSHLDEVTQTEDLSKFIL
ncbi:MAG: HslU--HslV peptidase ATPase subunit [Planctomycetaceae bacterium]|nr:HslU--HslV peptidase ATPase subunit [Planctomycetaceae bacterium]